MKKDKIDRWIVLMIRAKRHMIKECGILTNIRSPEFFWRNYSVLIRNRPLQNVNKIELTCIEKDKLPNFYNETLVYYVVFFYHTLCLHITKQLQQ